MILIFKDEYDNFIKMYSCPDCFNDKPLLFESSVVVCDKCWISYKPRIVEVGADLVK